MREHFYKIRLFFSVLIFLVIIYGLIGIVFPKILFNIDVTTVLPIIKTLLPILGCIIIVLTLFFGRIFCSLICPCGIMQDIVCAFFDDEGEKRENSKIKTAIKVILFCILILCAVVIIKLAPQTYDIKIAKILSVIFLSCIAVSGVIALLSKRILCIDYCPIGGILGFLSKFSLLKMYIDKSECLSCGMCERNCPAGCIDIDEQEIKNENCIKCFKCMSKCCKDALRYGIKK